MSFLMDLSVPPDKNSPSLWVRGEGAVPVFVHLSSQWFAVPVDTQSPEAFLFITTEIPLLCGRGDRREER